MGQRDRLAAVLVAGHLCHDLGGNVAGSKEAVRLLDHGLTDNCTVLEHILQIDQVAVMLLLRKIIGIVEMDDTGLMRAHNLCRKQDTAA